MTRASILALAVVHSTVGCAKPPEPPHAPPVLATAAALTPRNEDAPSTTQRPPENAAPLMQTEVTRAPAPSPPPECRPADWSAHSLAPLLKRGKATSSSWADRTGAAQLLFDSECTDSPTGPTRRSTNPVVVDGVEIRLVGVTPAGASGRGWIGNQCAFELRLADGSGRPVRLGAGEVAAFTTLNAAVRSGSALWLGIGFNGYTKEFPGGGNRVVAVDLCDGRVAWKSNDAMSNGGLLLVGDYLISPYGFTSERRYVFVLDAHSGHVVQKLPVVENLCPSKSWAPNWHPGERCDAPGQVVGAATAPRIEGGLFVVDTNTGSSTFEIVAAPGAGF